MERATLRKLAEAIAKVHGHPDPQGYADQIEAAFHEGDDKPAKKGRGK